MKNIVIMILLINLMVVSSGCSAPKEYKDQPNSFNSTDCEVNELKNFWIVVIDKEAAFREQYDECRIAAGKIIDILREDLPLEPSFKSEAIQITKKAQRKLEDFRESIVFFKDSSNNQIRKFVKEFLIINEYGNVVLKLYYEFVLDSQKFISSEEKVSKLAEYQALLKGQYDCIRELIEEVASSVKVDTASEATTEVIEFQYSQDELKSLERWKNKTMNELIFDAMNGDAVALYMLGMAHLYGNGGFSINVEQANKYFATSALLGFAPAIDKVKGMYVEDEEPNFLIFVYLNLTASFGHPEFTMLYHDRRKLIVEKFGNSMAREIERIAAEKAVRIYNVQKQMEKSSDRRALTVDLLYVENGFIGEDAKFNMDYWERFFDKKQY